MDSKTDKDKETVRRYDPSDQSLIHSHQLLQDEMLALKYYRLSLTKIRLVSEYVGLAVPLLVTVYYSWVRHQRHLLDLLRKHARVALLSYGGMLHVIRYETLLKLVRLRGETQYKESKAVEKDECVECEILHDPGPEARETDVIFIHGIKGALTKTWRQGRWERERVKLERLGASTTITRSNSTSEGESDQGDLENIFSRLRNLDEKRRVPLNEKGGVSEDDRSKCWPKDWLPLDCPNARVIAVNYTTDPNLWSPFWSNVPPRSTLPERAWEMIGKLTSLGVGEQPIVWVGHSKGGLYIKQMLANASESRDENDKQVFSSTKGILFYSVPHKGSRLAKFNFLPLILKRSIELTEVQDDCEEILKLDNKFRELLEKDEVNILIKSFVETSLTLMFIFYVRVVSLESGVNDFGEMYGVELDHRNICKPRNRHCFLYRELIDIIQRCRRMGT